MNVLGFLLVALVIAGVSAAWISLRGRKPRSWRGGSVETGISDFHREMQALAPRPGAVRRERITKPAILDDEDDA